MDFFPKARKAGNGFIDWDKVIVLDGSASQSFHALAIRELSGSLRRTPDGIRYIFIDHHDLTTSNFTTYHIYITRTPS